MFGKTGEKEMLGYKQRSVGEETEQTARRGGTMHLLAGKIF